MSRFRDLLLISALAAGFAGVQAMAGPYGVGRPALPEEIAAWDKDIAPDGTGLPPGAGDVETGEEIFAERCAACHGDFGEGLGLRPALVGGFGTLDGDDPVKTVGSFWPYLSTVVDYVRRSKPYGNAQTMTDDEVYAVVAYLLYSNDIVDEDFVLSPSSFASVEMPNRDGFVVDDRAGTEYPAFSGEPCMKDCKADVRITLRASALDVTPDSGNADGQAAGDETLVSGERAFAVCRPCHQIGPGAKNTTGPVLTGVYGRPAAGVADFAYSEAMRNAAREGLIWNGEELAAFLGEPETFLKGTSMPFQGLANQDEVAAVIAYLRDHGD